MVHARFGFAKLRMRDVPLRIRLVGAVLALVTVALLIADIAGSTALRGYLLDRVDSQLEGSSRLSSRYPALGSAVGRGGVEFSGNSENPALATAYYSALIDENGSGSGELQRPAGMNQSPPDLPVLDLETVRALDGQPFTVDAQDVGSKWRVLVTELPDEDGALIVATSLNDVDNTVDRLRFINFVVSVIVLILLGIIGYFAVKSSLRGLSQVEQTAEAIAAGDLSQRVPNDESRTEVGRLARSFNSMVAQIETAFASQRDSEANARASEEKMRRFVADASHELRTPLTSIRGFAELFRQGAVPNDQALRRLMGRIESEASRMGLLVEDLLLLARLDQQRPLERRPVDLLAIATDVVHDAIAIAPDHPTKVQLDTDQPAVVTGDDARLRQVITNLVNNAYTHTPAGTEVTLRLATAENTVVLEVIDNGPGMDEEHRQHVFERFYRVDAARTRTEGATIGMSMPTRGAMEMRSVWPISATGAGLGLSIVAALVAAHGGTVDVHSAPGQGARFVVTLPVEVDSPQEMNGSQEANS